MILVFDIGNTNIVIGIMDEEKILHRFRLQSNAHGTIDEYALTIMGLIDYHKVDRTKITAVAISSVVPQLTSTITAMVRKYIEIQPTVVSHDCNHGLKILLDNPRELGSDRLMSALAAHTIYNNKNCITVDFGTATTLEVVSAKGEFMGGTIFPGVKLAVNALHSNTAKLPMVDIVMPEKIVGKNTVMSIQSGIFYGYLSMVDGMIDRIIDEVFKGEEVIILGTGGMGSAFAKESKHNMTYEPNLILYGLYYLYKRYK